MAIISLCKKKSLLKKKKIEEIKDEGKLNQQDDDMLTRSNSVFLPVVCD